MVGSSHSRHSRAAADVYFLYQVLHCGDFKFLQPDDVHLH